MSEHSSQAEPPEGLDWLRGRPTARPGLLLRILVAVGSFTARHVCDLHWNLEGVENLPREVGYIAACAIHRNWIDAPLLVALLPQEPRIWYLGSGVAAFRSRWVEWLLRRIGRVPFDLGWVEPWPFAEGAIRSDHGSVDGFSAGRKLDESTDDGQRSLRVMTTFAIEIDGLIDCVSALVDNFRTGSFGAGFLPPAALAWPRGAWEDDYIRWDVSPASSAGKRHVRNADDLVTVERPVVERIRAKVRTRS